MSAPTVVCIAGMHRSGTSMVARLLNLAGVYLGREDELIPANQGNPDGHWEHARLVEINDAILTELGGGWDCPPDLAALADPMRLTRHWATAECLVQEFAPFAVWGWKDPRNSLTLRFWRALLPSLRVVVCVRNPLEVAVSLRHRGASSYLFGLSLWKTYNEQLIGATTPEQRVVTHYAEYFSNPIRETLRVAEALGLRVSHDALEALGRTPKRELRNSEFTTADLVTAGVAPGIIDLYAQLCTEAGLAEEDRSFSVGSGRESQASPGPPPKPADGEAAAPLDTVVIEHHMLRREVEHRGYMLDAVRAQLREAGDGLAEARSAASAAEARLAALQAELEHRDESIAALQLGTDEKDATIGRLMQDAAVREQMAAELSARDAALRRLEDQAAEHAATIDRLTEQHGHILDEVRARLRETGDGLAEARSAASAAEARLAALQAELEHRDETSAALQLRMDEKDATIGRLMQDAAVRDQMAAELSARDAALRRLEDQAAERAATIDRLTEQHGYILDELRARLREAGDGLAEARWAASSDKERLAELEAELERRDAAIVALRRATDEKDATIARLAELQAQTSMTTDATKARHAELEAELEDRDATIVALRRATEEKDVATGRLMQDAAVRAGEEHVAMIDGLTQELHRRGAEVRDLQAQLADQGQRTFGLLEEVVRLRTGPAHSSGAEAVGPSLELEEARAEGARLEVALNEERAARHRLDEEARAEGARLEAALNEESAVRRRLEEEARTDLARLEAALNEERAARRRLEGEAGHAYERLKHRLIQLIDRTIPRRRTVLMVSRGDDAFLALHGRQAWHFPRTNDGTWAGNPAESREVIAHLEALRAEGAEYLVFPATSRWWLEHYRDFRAHLHAHYWMVVDDEDTGTVFEITVQPWRQEIETAIEEFKERFGSEPAVLDWDSGLDLASVYPGRSVFSPPLPSRTLPHLDRSVDIVVCPRVETAVAEARRVARGMIVTVAQRRSASNGNGSHRVSVEFEWLNAPSRPPGRRVAVPRATESNGSRLHRRTPRGQP